MAFAQYYKASKEEWAKELAVKTFQNIGKRTYSIFLVLEQRKSNPKGQWLKQIPSTRGFKGLSVPMIDINLCEEMKEALPDLDVETRILNDINEVFAVFPDPEGRGFFR